MQRQVIAKNAAAGYETALKIEQQAKEAGISLDKDAMRRLETSRYIEAAKKAEFQSDQAHNTHPQKAEAFRSGIQQTAAAKKTRKEDYRTGKWGK
ncbi:hypothetical protein FLA4_05580 [Candidatus Rickettsia kotlanii]|nr:hypothetical protein FLA4_05580 [Candidatus Rickettsia kotlanii]BDU61391.1 hypothetical protein HM2_05590 [Candidatus Rickettsia kotlanii]